MPERIRHVYRLRANTRLPTELSTLKRSGAQMHSNRVKWENYIDEDFWKEVMSPLFASERMCALFFFAAFAGCAVCLFWLFADPN